MQPIREHSALSDQNKIQSIKWQVNVWSTVHDTLHSFCFFKENWGKTKKMNNLRRQKLERKLECLTADKACKFMFWLIPDIQAFKRKLSAFQELCVCSIPLLAHIVTGLLHRGSYYLIQIQTIHCQFITFFLSSFCTQPESGAEFRYIDKWSSSFTWGGETPPEAGDLVQIPSGQIILLDVNTPVLSMLIIEGRSCCPK